MREIRESVWLDAVILQSKNHDFVVCDDVRFVNEAKNLKDDGWVLVKLDIDEDLQNPAYNPLTVMIGKCIGIIEVTLRKQKWTRFL